MGKICVGEVGETAEMQVGGNGDAERPNQSEGLWIVQGGSTVGAGARDDLCGAAIYDRTHQEATCLPATETCRAAGNPVMKDD
jgi:hypothetical protein